MFLKKESLNTFAQMNCRLESSSVKTYPLDFLTTNQDCRHSIRQHQIRCPDIIGASSLILRELVFFLFSAAKALQTRNMSSAKPPQTPVTPKFPDPAMPPSAASSLVDGSSASYFSSGRGITTSTDTRARKEASLLNRRFAHVLRPLAPLLSIETGVAHPRFPRTLLQYYLLTSAELEDLAHFYHQRTASTFSMQYPMPVVSRWHAPADTELVDAEILELSEILGMPLDDEHMRSLRQLKSKRHRFGRFLGLQGLESGNGEGTMREEMERWVASEMARRERRDTELDSWRSKRC